VEAVEVLTLVVLEDPAVQAVAELVELMTEALQQTQLQILEVVAVELHNLVELLGPEI
jgi:hypothetical protein